MKIKELIKVEVKLGEMKLTLMVEGTFRREGRAGPTVLRRISTVLISVESSN